MADAAEKVRTWPPLSQAVASVPRRDAASPRRAQPKTALQAQPPASALIRHRRWQYPAAEVDC